MPSAKAQKIVNKLYLIDTNTVSYIVRGTSPAARAHLIHLPENSIAAISVITEAEIHYGLAKAAQARALHSAMQGFLSRIRILAWGSQEAQTYGALRAALEASGKTLGNLDMLIAAQAISAGAILVTNDKTFRQVKALRGIVNWATDLPRS